ncbi:hypothetical protein ACFSUS_10310 [Spirosoma soli]|uniref:Uncharacterized protein n=1 Tax=Spirosoma soli TaxID=1770529 RepID=A0ABW5M5R9_9BACT
MLTQLRKHYSPSFWALNVALAIGVSACSSPDKLEPQATPPAQYELTDVRYFLKPTDRVDTVTVKLKELSVQNLSNTLSTQQVESSFDELVRTSQFEVDQVNTLPKEVKLDKFAVRVPQNWYGQNLFDYYAEPFPLSPDPQQKPYGGYKNQVMTIRVPAKSKININRQIDAYYLTCSFEGTIQNKTTGQRYPLTGKWTGLLRYNNTLIDLKQSPLP